MIVDYTNFEIINPKDIYIHDYIFEGFNFDYNYNGIKLHIDISDNAEINEKRVAIDFLNVIGFEMTSSCFWGYSHRILDFEYVERDETVIISKTFENFDRDDYIGCPLKEREKYIETIITLCSGDELTVACEKISINFI